MAKMKKLTKFKINKKAVFFTLSMFFLASAVLLLAIVAFNFTETKKIERVKESYSLDRLFDLSGSIENSAKQIFDLYSSMNADIIQNSDGTSNISVRDEISRDQDKWSEEFEDNIENFDTFVEERDDNVKLDMEIIQDKELPLTIYPHNITYSRNWETGHVILGIVPQTLNFGSYFVLVDSGSTRIDKVESQLRGSGSFYFGVRAKDAYGKDIIKDKMVNPSNSHQVQVFFKDGNKVKITLINNNLEIWTNSANEINITTTIGNLEKTNESINMNYLEGAINVSLSPFDILKIGSIGV